MNGLSGKMDEFELIRLLTEGRQPQDVQRENGIVVGIGDDAAVVESRPDMQWVVSVDTMVELVHFNRYTMRDADIGYKALASNISDMAAMGAIPRYALVALSCPSSYGTERLQALYDGLYECAGTYGVAIIGGDTTSAAMHMTISVTVIGQIEPNRALLRSSARSGDLVFVTGPLGLSAAGLHYLSARHVAAEEEQPSDVPEWADPLVAAHRRPRPSVDSGRLLAGTGLRAALNDVSDGLASEAWEIAEASGCALELDAQRIPVHEALTAYGKLVGQDPMEWILFGGEDYQLVGTLPDAHVNQVRLLFEQASLPFAVIGKVSAGAPGVSLKEPSGKLVPLDKKGYNHFG